MNSESHLPNWRMVGNRFEHILFDKNVRLIKRSASPHDSNCSTHNDFFCSMCAKKRWSRNVNIQSPVPTEETRRSSLSWYHVIQNFIRWNRGNKPFPIAVSGIGVSLCYSWKYFPDHAMVKSLVNKSSWDSIRELLVSFPLYSLMKVRQTKVRQMKVRCENRLAKRTLL